MSTKKLHCGYVKVTEGSGKGQILLQIPDAQSRFGFYLCDDDQSWDGGIGIANSWEKISEKKVPTEDKERLGWILEDQKSAKC